MQIKDLPCGSAIKALHFSHFPTRQQAVVWRNWDIVPIERIASTLQTNPESIRILAAGMGLIENKNNYDIWHQRGYVTIIRRNWHLLPYEQILELLDWTPEKMAFTLKEDDFLWHKLGLLKPQATPLKYTPLSEDEKIATKNLFRVATFHFPEDGITEEQPFDFLKTDEEYNKKPNNNLPAYNFGMKLAYSYSAVYGDPFLDDTLDPYPDTLLSQYSSRGVNAVWLQGTLYTLLPWLGESKYSINWEKRLNNLKILSRRIAKHGIKLYLYFNEPRNMPEDFFTIHPDWKGSITYDGHASLCTSNPEVLNALREGMARLFTEVPELGGVFTITMSENLTHCKSRSDLSIECPICNKRNPAELPAEVNRAIADGIHSVNPAADVIAWSWGWNPKWDLQTVELMPKDIKLMCVSETNKETNAMGIKGTVIDYSMSKIGPGPNAEKLWNKAAKCGLQSVAKVQINNTWECSSIPYIPVPDLVEEHLKNLDSLGISGIMVSWTLGGYSGGNLELLQQSKETLAKEKFGANASTLILKAWTKFSDAFREFPLNGTNQLYLAPQNYGPANLLFAESTGYCATMVGFPYDDLAGWCGNHYPENVFEEQFKKLSEGWGEGITLLLSAEKHVPKELQENFRDLTNVSEAAYCLFRSSYLQIRFIRLRETKENNELLQILDEEIELAKQLLKIVKRDSRIGFEASNHYYYTKNDLMEKVLNCEYLKVSLNKKRT